MHEFVIESVVKTQPWINGMEAHLDEPSSASFAKPRQVLSLQGWIVCAAERITNVSLAWQYKSIAVGKILTRRDVEKIYNNSRHVVGFRIDMVPAVFGDDIPLQIVVEVEGGRSCVLFELTLRYTDAPRLRRDDTVTFAPLVCSPRSGTTYLAQLLHRHTQILGHDHYPFEARIGVRLSEAWFANLQPRFYELEGSRDNETVDQNLLAVRQALCNEDSASAAPLGDFFAQIGEHHRRRIIGMYRLLAPHAGGSAIVEKLGPFRDLYLISALFKCVRPIFIVRDPRDMLVSMRAFNAKRGVYDLHETYARNFADVLSITATNLMHVASLYDRWRGEKLLVRYEELVRDPATVLQRILAFIRIDDSAQAVASVLERSHVQSDHSTSPSPDSSIGRWRKVLSPSEARAANWAFEPYLRRFDYFEA